MTSFTAPTVRQLLAEYRSAPEQRFEAELLLAHVLTHDRAWLFAHANEVLPAAVVEAFAALMQRREAGEPVAYLTGHRGFWSLDLKVTPATLIPRPETELLVEQALAKLPVGAATEVADLGTGSGAVALAIASERPLAQVLATDASAAALEVARDNAARLGVRNVECLHGSWLEPLVERRFDVIVSNPPYIEAGDAHLREGDLRYEPAMALASGLDGLDAIRSIVHGALNHLLPGGWLLLEHGWNQGQAVRALLEARGYDAVFTVQDLEARDRVSGGVRAA